MSLWLLPACIRRYGLTTSKRVSCGTLKQGLLPGIACKYFSTIGVLEESKVLKEVDPRIWATSILNHYKKGQDEEAIRLYHLTVDCNAQLTLSGSVFVAVLKACANTGALVQGRLIHVHIKDFGLEADVFVGSTLIHLYAKCGSIEDACSVFNRLPVKDVGTYNSMISGYVETGFVEEAIQLFHQMQLEGMHPDRVSFLNALKACSATAGLEQGMLIHSLINAGGFQLDLFVTNTLADMYAKCGSLKLAREVFGKSVSRDQILWSTMVRAFAEHGYHQEALQLFQQMQLAGIYPSKVTLLSILTACSGLAALSQGKLLHSLVLESGFELDVFIGTSLIDMYSKCGGVKDAREVFDGLQTKDLVCWTALIAGYAQNGCEQEALELFKEMQQQGLHPNATTFASVLKACCSTTCLEQGRLIHASIIQRGMDTDTVVANALINLYAKCGSLEDACNVFSMVVERDLVSWNALIAGHAHYGYGQKALELFEQMQLHRMAPDKITFASVLKACSSVAALSQGKMVHGLVVELGFDSDTVVGSTLIDMYAKSGSLKDAEAVFQRLPKTNSVSWNSMIVGYAQHGEAKGALQTFANMQAHSIEPDNITFLALLSACGHAGMVDNANGLLSAMWQDFGIAPEPEHYACMVDLLGRAGHLFEAEYFINNLPSPPDAMLFMSLLGACRTHRNIELGERAFKSILQLDPRSASAYTLMARTYAECGSWDEWEETTKKMRRAGLQKEPGCTWMDLENQVQTFVVEDKFQPNRKRLYATLERLLWAIERNEQIIHFSHSGLAQGEVTEVAS